MKLNPPYFAEIRPAVPADEDAVVNICHKTFYGGPDFPYPELIGYRWAVWYIRNSSEFSFVAVDEEDMAVGYILCAPDSRLYEKSYHEKIVPVIREICGKLKETHPELYLRYLSLFLPEAEEYSTPMLCRVVRKYPAHLHIDLLPEYQKMGLGGKLMNKLLERLKAACVPGVHLIVDSDNDDALGYYGRFGFKILNSRKTHSGKDYIMGLQLNTERNE